MGWRPTGPPSHSGSTGLNEIYMGREAMANQTTFEFSTTMVENSVVLEMIKKNIIIAS
jgi:hypothetical protein